MTLDIPEEIIGIIQKKDDFYKGTETLEEEFKKIKGKYIEPDYNGAKFAREIDILIRQGIRDALIRSGVYRPYGINEIIEKINAENYAIIPDTGIIERSLLSKYILKKLSLLFSEKYFISIPRHIFWELENNTRSSNDDKKRRGYRGLQEINDLKQFPTQIFDLKIPQNFNIISSSGDRPSTDAIARAQIREYSRQFSSLIKTCFITNDKMNYVLSKMEEINCYFIETGDLFSIDQVVNVPYWDSLHENVYINISNIIYELAVVFGEIIICDNKECSDSEFELIVKGDYLEKKADDWINGKIKIILKEGSHEEIERCIGQPHENILIIQRFVGF